MNQRLILYCLTALFPAALTAQNHADCAAAMEICKKQTYNIDRAGGEGADDGTDFTACFMNGDNNGQAEENSTWIKFEIAKKGTLTFAITPYRSDDDIDFVVYLLPADGNCRAKQIVRCMAAGAPEDEASFSSCMGETGLRDGEKDSSEDAGCSDANDNAWLAPLRVEAGEKYVILVSNVSTRGPGFSIRFSGTCKLPCDDEKPVAAKPSKPAPPSGGTTAAKPDRTNVAPPKPAKKEEPPKTIGGRQVEIDKEEVKVKNRSIKVRLRDNQVEDGDIVSIYLDDKKVINNVYLRLQPQEFDVQLPPGKREFFLTVYAEDFGKSGYGATAYIEIDDGARKQTIDLSSSRTKQQSVRVTVER